MKVGICGLGYVGKAYNKMFPDAVLYDKLKGIGTKNEINKTDMVVVAVPTNPMPDGSLDMSIIEEVVGWIETPLILIKSALMPGTVDYLKEKYNKRITVSVEMVGEGKYFIPYWKYPHPENPLYHSFIIVGGDEKDATETANYLWHKMSPEIDIHIVSAVEAEICKMMENTWGAMKVSFANDIYEICQRYGANYTKVLQAWGADGRVEKMHMRVIDGKRGWKSKCYDKDIPGLIRASELKGYEPKLIKAVVEANKEHLKQNDLDR
mgnify:CR=1 FL=1